MPGPWDPDTNRIVFTPTLADTVAAYRLSAMPGTSRLLLQTVCFAICFAAIGFILNPGDLAGSALDTVVGCAIWIALRLAYARAIIPLVARRIYRQQAALRDEYTITWDAAGLQAKTIRVTLNARWGDYRKRRENGAVVLLYQSDVLFQFLPTRVLTDAHRAALAPYMLAIPLKP